MTTVDTAGALAGHRLAMGPASSPGPREAVAVEPKVVVPALGQGVDFSRPVGAKAAPPAAGSAFMPLLLLAGAIVVWFGAQTAQLAVEYRQLARAEADLQPQVQTAARLRASLDGVASATARLATDGNVNARAVVDELRRRGVTIDPNKALSK